MSQLLVLSGQSIGASVQHQSHPMSYWEVRSRERQRHREMETERDSLFSDLASEVTSLLPHSTHWK